MNAPFKPANEAAATFVRRHIGPSPRDIDAMLETRRRREPDRADRRDAAGLDPAEGAARSRRAL